MKKKYNIALVPTSKSEEFIKISNKLSHIADQYLLGDRSLPHVTLYQFEIDESDIDNVWSQVCKVWNGRSIELLFSNFSCITFDNRIYWASLLPNNCDILHKTHAEIADAIKLPIKQSFDPHLTLISTKNKDYENEVDKLSKSYITIGDAFILSIGRSDAIGQLAEIIYKYEKSKTYKL